eukprot:scaffold10687_cov53-Phaeocystis_antarctica.AAC.4
MRASTDPPLRSHLITSGSSPRSADRMILSGSRAGELTTGSPASGWAAGEAGAGCGGAACCRMSSAMVVWPLSSAHCRAVWPSLSSSSVLALARSRACTHASCPPEAAAIRAVRPLLDSRSGLAECCSSTSKMERWSWITDFMSAVMPWMFRRSMLAPRFSSSLTISRWLLAAAACSRVAVEGWPPAVGEEQNALISPPLPSHLTTSGSSPRCADWWISRGSEAGELTAGSPTSGAAAGETGAGCDGAACCRISSAMAGGLADFVEQLGVGLGSQQGLHACFVPLVSGMGQGGGAVDVLQVGVGRVLQQEEHDGQVAVGHSIHERGAAVAGWQVNARASLQQLPHDLQVAEGEGPAINCGSEELVDQPSLAQPLDHLLQLASQRCAYDLNGNRVGRAHRCSASLVGTDAAKSGGPTREPAAARARRPCLGRRGRVAQREAEQSAQPATWGGSFIHPQLNISALRPTISPCPPRIAQSATRGGASYLGAQTYQVWKRAALFASLFASLRVALPACLAACLVAALAAALATYLPACLAAWLAAVVARPVLKAEVGRQDHVPPRHEARLG